MKRVGIFYGSTIGATEEVAQKIGKKLNSEVFNISEVDRDKMEEYDILILGSSTWGYGDLQDDWATFFDINGLPNLENKIVAIFGLGDQADHYDMFVNAIGTLHDIAISAKATITGYTSIDGYSFGSSTTAVRNGHFLGLALDEVTQPHLTEERVDNWLKTISRLKL